MTRRRTSRIRSSARKSGSHTIVRDVKPPSISRSNLARSSAAEWPASSKGWSMTTRHVPGLAWKCASVSQILDQFPATTLVVLTLGLLDDRLVVDVGELNPDHGVACVPVNVYLRDP